MSNVPAAFLAERERQKTAEGYDASHDDAHVNGDMLVVARMYWQRVTGVALPMVNVVISQARVEHRGLHRGSVIPAVKRSVPISFPWDAHWWKPKTPQRDLERAGALCLAEIDRLTRAGLDASHVEEQLELIVNTYNGLVSA